MSGIVPPRSTLSVRPGRTPTTPSLLRLGSAPISTHRQCSDTETSAPILPRVWNDAPPSIDFLVYPIAFLRPYKRLVVWKNVRVRQGALPLLKRRPRGCFPGYPLSVPPSPLAPMHGSEGLQSHHRG